MTIQRKSDRAVFQEHALCESGIITDHHGTRYLAKYYTPKTINPFGLLASNKVSSCPHGQKIAF
jgi:hypothetical protein